MKPKLRVDIRDLLVLMLGSWIVGATMEFILQCPLAKEDHLIELSLLSIVCNTVPMICLIRLIIKQSKRWDADVRQNS